MDGSVRVRAGDSQGRENISRYLIRAPFSVEKIQFSCREGSVEAPSIENDTAEARAARRAWARLIKKIYEVDLQICPECAIPMRVISIIEEQEVIRKVLEHLKLWEEPEPHPLPAIPEQLDIQYVPFFDS